MGKIIRKSTKNYGKQTFVRGGQNTNSPLEKKKITKKKKTLLMFFISLFSIALISIGTYALWNAGSDLLTGSNTIQSGQVKMSYTEENSLKLDNALPMKDEDGKKLDTYFDFTVSSWIKTNKSDSTERKLSYNIILEPTVFSITGNGETIEVTPSNEMLWKDMSPEEAFKVYLTSLDTNENEKKVTGPILISELNSYLLRSQEEIFKNGKEQVDTKYRLRAWMSFDVDPYDFEQIKYQFKFKINVNGTK